MSADHKPPWYADGLRFACTGCGNCCTGSPGAVWVDEEEIAAIAAELGESPGAVRLLHTRPLRGRVSLREHANGDCVFFDPWTRRCRVYAARPRQCRTWPFWPRHLASEADWAAVGRACPGVGSGPLVPVEVIERAAAATAAGRPAGPGRSTETHTAH